MVVSMWMLTWMINPQSVLSISNLFSRPYGHLHGGEMDCTSISDAGSEDDDPLVFPCGRRGELDIGRERPPTSASMAVRL